MQLAIQRVKLLIDPVVFLDRADTSLPIPTMAFCAARNGVVSARFRAGSDRRKNGGAQAGVCSLREIFMGRPVISA